jgi:hypothetical protein
MTDYQVLSCSYTAWGRTPNKTSTLASARCCLGTDSVENHCSFNCCVRVRCYALSYLCWLCWPTAWMSQYIACFCLILFIRRILWWTFHILTNFLCKYLFCNTTDMSVSCVTFRKNNVLWHFSYKGYNHTNSNFHFLTLGYNVITFLILDDSKRKSYLDEYLKLCCDDYDNNNHITQHLYPFCRLSLPPQWSWQQALIAVAFDTVSLWGCSKRLTTVLVFLLCWYDTRDGKFRFWELYSWKFLEAKNDKLLL